MCPWDGLLNSVPTVARLALASPLAGLYDYAAHEGIAPGAVVRVKLRGKDTLAVVWEVNPADAYSGKLQPIAEVLTTTPPLRPGFRRFLSWAAEYTVAEVGAYVKMVLGEYAEPPPPKARAVDSRINAPRTPDVDFNPTQLEAVQALCTSIGEGFSTFLLDGITGSGKTEVFLSAVNTAIAQGTQALILVPEIALASSLAERIARHADAPVFLWHSDVTPAKRRGTWGHLMAGEPAVVLAARSGLFLPLPKLGLIVVDEEHDGSYKQDDGVRYHGRDLAVVRAKEEAVPVILASATPSFESLYNAQQGRYRHLVLTGRAGSAQLPTVSMIDMRTEKLPAGQWLSTQARTAITEVLSRGEQALLFLNRRGYAPLTLCRACGHRWQCPTCTAWLVTHRRTGQLHCHHCGYQQDIPTTCPACDGKDTVAACGPGIERLAEEATAAFPDDAPLLLSSDHLPTAAAWGEALPKVANGSAQLLIGTQVIAKGHHFPGLTLVVVVDADVGLGGGDVRAAEKTWSLLHQVSGRAGRGEKPGRVLMQTYQPENPVLQTLATGDRAGFFTAQLEERSIAGLPPFGRLAAIIISAQSEEAAHLAARTIAAAIPADAGPMVLGPAAAPLAILRGWHRVRFLVMQPTRQPALAGFLRAWLNAVPALPKGIKIAIDIDPIGFL
jgi:primosomal protein N' (replication factor Y)